MKNKQKENFLQLLNSKDKGNIKLALRLSEGSAIFQEEVEKYLKLRNALSTDIEQEEDLIDFIIEFNEFIKTIYLIYYFEQDYQYENLELFLEALVNFPNIKELDSDGLPLPKIPLSLFENRQLENLDFVGSEVQEIPSQIEQLSGLKTLNLSENKIETLPATMANLKSLEQLFLTQNTLKEIPEAITGLENLKELYLEDNKIENIPDSISSLQNLKVCSCIGSPMAYI